LKAVLLAVLVNSHDYGLDGRIPTSGDHFRTEQLDLEVCIQCVNELKNLGIDEFDDLYDELNKKFDQTVPIETVAKIVSKFNLKFPIIVQKLNVQLTQHRINQPPKLDRKSYLRKDVRYRQNVIDLLDYFENNLSWAFKGFYLHGSLSTLDYVKGSSDCDTFGIIRQEVSSSTESLLKLRKDLRETFLLICTIRETNPRQSIL